MNNKININPSSTKWLEKDDRVVADYFCDLGFRSLKQILDMRVFDLMNMQGLNAVRVEEVIICLYKWLNPNTAIDEAIYNGMMSQPFLYTPWRKEHKDLAAIKVGDLVLTPGINMKAMVLKNYIGGMAVVAMSGRPAQRQDQAARIARFAVTPESLRVSMTLRV